MFRCLGVLISVLTMASCNISEYFPGAKTNLTSITWEHAVNNLELLKSSLESDVNMLEADVSIGKSGDKENIPIMAHPPKNTSDLTLETFLTTVINHNQHPNATSFKGIKLDFKSIDAFKASTTILENNLKDLKLVWLNADILPGPVNATTKPVDALEFLKISSEQFENFTLSIGWTTNYNSDLAGEKYLNDQIDKMIETINTVKPNNTITFPVRAGIAAESLEQMKILVDNVTASTLTIWGSENDTVNVDHLRSLIFEIGLNRVYIDLPASLRAKLDLGSGGNRAGHLGVFTVLLSTFIMFMSSKML